MGVFDMFYGPLSFLQSSFFSIASSLSALGTPRPPSVTHKSPFWPLSLRPGSQAQHHPGDWRLQSQTAPSSAQSGTQPGATQPQVISQAAGTLPAAPISAALIPVP